MKNQYKSERLYLKEIEIDNINDDKKRQISALIDVLSEI